MRKFVLIFFVLYRLLSLCRFPYSLVRSKLFYIICYHVENLNVLDTKMKFFEFFIIGQFIGNNFLKLLVYHGLLKHFSKKIILFFEGWCCHLVRNVSQLIQEMMKLVRGVSRVNKMDLFTSAFLNWSLSQFIHQPKKSYCR